MVALRFDQTVPHERRFVYDWHARPGAVRRLTAPFAAEVVAEPDVGVTPGGRTRLRVRHLPPPAARWTTEYTAVVPGEEYTARMVSGPMRRWEHRRMFEDLGGTTRVRDEIEFWLPRRSPEFASRAVMTTVARFVGYRHAQLLDDLQFAATHNGGPRRIAVSGSRGLIGTQLTALLSTLGHEVVPIVRSAERVPGAVALDVAGARADTSALEGVDVVVHLAGAPIAGWFTPGHKRRVADSRIGPTQALARAAAEAGVPTFVSASAIGFYGATPPGIVTEDSPVGQDYLARVCAQWEDATLPAREAGARVAMVRTGIVLTPAGGALAQQLPLFRVGAGGPLAGGAAWQSWISVDDAVGIFAHAALSPGVSGPINAVAPSPVTSGEFARELGHIMSRPSAIPIPIAGPAVRLGPEGARLLASASQQVSAAKASATGYEFRHPTLGVALRHLLGQAA